MTYNQIFLLLLIAGIFSWFISLVRRGNRQLAEPNPKHVSLLKDFKKDELAFAYNMTLTGLLMSREYKSSNAQIKAEVEIALSLYIELMKNRGVPIILRQKSKLRQQLTKLAVFSSIKKYHSSMHKFRVNQDIDEPEDWDGFQSRLTNMLLALE